MVANPKQYENAGGSNVTDIRDASPKGKAKEQLSMAVVRRRLEILKFDEKDASALTALREWANANMDQLAREFYDFQFQQPEIVAKVTEVGSSLRVGIHPVVHRRTDEHRRPRGK